MGPMALNRTPLAFKVLLHRQKCLDHSFDSLAELRTREIPLDNRIFFGASWSHVLILSELDQVRPEHGCEPDGQSQISDPNTVDQFKAPATLRPSDGNENGDFGLNAALVLTQLREPSRTPLSGVF